jgi:hypothetical protein
MTSENRATPDTSHDPLDIFGYQQTYRSRISHRGNIVKHPLLSIAPLAAFALLTSSTLALAQGWQTDKQGTSVWHVQPRGAQCNVSKARNKVIRAGIYQSEIVYHDENVLTFRGLTQNGDRKEITFGNEASCPELEARDIP